MSDPKPYAMIDADGKVYNVAMWDGESEWQHDAAQLVQSDTAAIGYTYADGEFTPPMDEAMTNLLRIQKEATEAGFTTTAVMRTK
jgi:hypothetical protein